MNTRTRYSQSKPSCSRKRQDSENSFTIPTTPGKVNRRSHTATYATTSSQSKIGSKLYPSFDCSGIHTNSTVSPSHQFVEELLQQKILIQEAVRRLLETQQRRCLSSRKKSSTTTKWKWFLRNSIIKTYYLILFGDVAHTTAILWLISQY